jgi:hypothetical protein
MGSHPAASPPFAPATHYLMPAGPAGAMRLPATFATAPTKSRGVSAPRRETWEELTAVNQSRVAFRDAFCEPAS